MKNKKIVLLVVLMFAIFIAIFLFRNYGTVINIEAKIESHPLTNKIKLVEGADEKIIGSGNVIFEEDLASLRDDHSMLFSNRNLTKANPELGLWIDDKYYKLDPFSKYYFILKFDMIIGNELIIDIKNKDEIISHYEFPFN
ncbi:MAG: hypothetical protein PT956_02485 [Firmicutes bacterium]|nr:hypothetical protein [Bacillota bacterium]